MTVFLTNPLATREGHLALACMFQIKTMPIQQMTQPGGQGIRYSCCVHPAFQNSFHAFLKYWRNQPFITKKHDIGCEATEPRVNKHCHGCRIREGVNKLHSLLRSEITTEDLLSKSTTIHWRKQRVKSPMLAQTTTDRENVAQ